MVAHAASGFTEKRSSAKEALKIASEGCDSVGEKQQPVVRYRKVAADSSAINFPAQAELVRAPRPTQRIKPHKTVRERFLRLLRERTERERAECKAINVGITIRRGQVDAHLRIRDRRNVMQLVTDDVDSEAELIHQRVGEQVCLGKAPHAVVQGNVQRKVQVIRRGRAASLHLK